MKELGASPEETGQLSTMMKERVKLREAEKDAEMIEKSTVQLGEQKDELEVCVYVHVLLYVDTVICGVLCTCFLFVVHL